MQTHAAALARHLHGRGHQIELITYAHTGDPTPAAAYDAAQPFPTHRCLSRLSYWANIRTLQAHTARFQPELIYSSTPFYGLLQPLTSIPVVCRSVGNDVMRCWVPYPFRPGSAFLAAPAIERLLESIHRRLNAPAWLESWLFRARRRLVRRAARSAARVIANSDYTRERLLEFALAPERVDVVPGGVEVSAFAGAPDPALRARLGLAGGGPVVLTVCRLVLKKGVDVLLEAVARARRTLPEITLLVVGQGREAAKCRRLAARLGLEGAVRFLGAVPHPAIPAYYHLADCFVLASRIHRRRNGWADVETMGRVLCEANAAGVPVIATQTGGVPSLVTHDENGFLTPPDDPDALAAALVALWQAPERRARLVQAGRARASTEFDWSVVLGAYERAFARTLAEGLRHPAPPPAAGEPAPTPTTITDMTGPGD
jgi:glycosyltransferase involved in cell wall biosynthesis